MTENGRLTLYERLLELAEKESEAMLHQNIDMLEEYSLRKDEIIREIESLEEPMSTAESAEVETIIKKILVLQEQNIQAIQKMKICILNDGTAVQKNRIAHRAYLASQ